MTPARRSDLKNSTTVRFSWKGVLERLAPRLVEDRLFEAWLTPPRLARARAPKGGLPFGLETPQGTLAAYEWLPPSGQGETVLLVHGWGGSAVAFEKLAPVLALAGRHVVAIDLPAHGLSPGRRTNLRELSEVVQLALWRLRPTAAVAHSFGAPATALALERGPRLERLVLLAPGEDLEAFAYTFARRAGFSEAMGRKLIERTAQVVGASPAAMSLRHHPAPAGTEVLVVHDPQDDDVPFTAARTIAATWPKVEVLAAPGAGHHGLPRHAQVIEAAARFVVEGEVTGATFRVLPGATAEAVGGAKVAAPQWPASQRPSSAMHAPEATTLASR